MEVTIGGNRVGSGKKMTGRINNYNRSTHNLSEKWASSMGSGILYPCLCKVATRGDSFDISINADARTIPTKGPLFGSYKMQVDIYQVPIRLYQGILHNNPLAIGLKMNQVKFPQMHLSTLMSKHDNTFDLEAGKVNNTSLLKYLGLSGLGSRKTDELVDAVARDINALPMLGYYDIVKTYYANKQEGKGYVIGNEYSTNTEEVGEFWTQNVDDIRHYNFSELTPTSTALRTINIITKKKLTNEQINELKTSSNAVMEIGNDNTSMEFHWNQLATYNILAIFNNELYENHTLISFNANFNEIFNTSYENQNINYVYIENPEVTIGYNSNLTTNEFDLQNIDDMRYELLGSHTLGTTYYIGLGGDWDDESGTDQTGLPYSSLFRKDEFGNAGFKQPLSGLCLKTYQNDMFNNWLNTDWIEGENGINELSKVEIVNGAFSMDSLNFATKLYNMLNRIAVAGATYEDWQDVVYEEVKRKQIESPIFCGGMSQEIYFDEIVQSAPTEGQPLGTLGGRGRLSGQKKGGKMHIKCDEACFIIGIVSLTPRIYYTQGNEFYLTELESMDDLHKPAMDGIGFQDLLGERLAWWDAHVTNTGVRTSVSKIGKLPAWIEYMTSVDKAYGDFAGEYGAGFMILNRNYEPTASGGLIKDASTYVDPAKYNYAFADASLTAQNFWTQINFDIKARRLMSARIIPNV